MLVVYAPVIFGIHWAVSGGLLSATVGYLGLWAAYILWYQGVRAFIFGRAPPRTCGLKHNFPGFTQNSGVEDKCFHGLLAYASR